MRSFSQREKVAAKPTDEGFRTQPERSQPLTRPPRSHPLPLGEGRSARSSALQSGRDPFVQTNACLLCGRDDRTMQWRIDADDELTRKRLLGFLATLLAEGEIILDGIR